MSLSREQLSADLAKIKGKKQAIDARLTALMEETSRLKLAKSQLEKMEQEKLAVLLEMKEADDRMAAFRARVVSMDESTVLSELRYQQERLQSVNYSLSQIEGALNISVLKKNSSAFEANRHESYLQQRSTFITQWNEIKIFIQMLEQKKQEFIVARQNSGKFSPRSQSAHDPAPGALMIDADKIFENARRQLK